jgi:hypothetical protein
MQQHRIKKKLQNFDVANLSNTKNNCMEMVSPKQLTQIQMQQQLTEIQ